MGKALNDIVCRAFSLLPTAIYRKTILDVCENNLVSNVSEQVRTADFEVQITRPTYTLRVPENAWLQGRLQLLAWYSEVLKTSAQDDTRSAKLRLPPLRHFLEVASEGMQTVLNGWDGPPIE